MLHNLLTLTESATQVEAIRVHGVSRVRHTPAWFVKCGCGWKEKAGTSAEAQARFERHQRGSQTLR